MELQEETQHTPVDKKSKKLPKETIPAKASASSLEISETKAMSIKVTFEGEAARKILQCESELRERLSKPDMGKVIGAEILTWTEKRWSEIIEENTDIDYFFAQIRKCSDRSKSIKLLKALSEKLKSENLEGSAPVGTGASLGLSHAPAEELQSDVG